MSTAAFHPVGGLEALENGLNILRRSRLMVVPEFKDMYGAIERHHRDLKLAHLTGKAKDLQEQAIRDTKFYNILVKMLCEIKEKRSGEQREGLRRVHTWYMANKHVLYCGPRFGKERIKEEAREVLRTATTPRKAATPGGSKRAKSAKERPLSSKVIPSRSGRHSTRSYQYIGSPGKHYPSIQSTPRVLGDVQTFSYRADMEDLDNFELMNPVGANSPEVDEFDLGLQYAANEEELMRSRVVEVPGDQQVNVGGMGPGQSTRVLSRPKTAATVTFSPLKEQNSNSGGGGSVRRMVHPISSLVNPHTALAKELSPIDAEHEDTKRPVIMRATSAKPSRPENLQAWQMYNKNRVYGQDVLGKLDFLGRSGTTSDVRYTAHGHGETPEMHTQDFIHHYAMQPSSPDISPRSFDTEENIFVQQTLEEFYQTAENIRPTTRSTPRRSDYARVKSAPPRRSVSTKTSGQVASRGKSAKVTTRQGGQQGQEASEVEQERPQDAERDTGVKLDTVINVIDSVSDDMAFFKEKLAPKPQPGFRQPSTVGVPTPRETASTAGHDVTLESPCPSPAVDHKSEDEAPRPFSSPLASRTVIIREDAHDGQRKAKVRCSSAGVVDWRGRIRPDSVRYKWSKTKFGGHTYLKKWYRPSLRSAGSTSAGKRPKTAPITAKEKWKTQRESDKNTRAVQAASHSTMVVNQGDVDNMMQVQHLLSGEDRVDSTDSLFDFDEGFWKSLRKTTPTPSAEPPAMEFLSFITPSAAAIAEQKSQISTHRSDTAAEENDHTAGLSTSVENQETAPRGDLQIHVPHSVYNEDALNAAVREEQESVRHKEDQQQKQPSEDLRTSHTCSPSPSSALPFDDHGADTDSLAPPTSHTDQSESHIHVTAVPSGGRGPAPSHQRTLPLQNLTQSEQWQFSTEEGFDPQDTEAEEKGKKGDHFCDVQLGPEHFCAECRPFTMSTRVERTAGRMPSRTHSASTQMLAYSRRYSDALRRAPPLRTPPSIPTPQTSAKKPERRRGQIFLELEHHARKTRSPRNFMHKESSPSRKKKVEALRSMDSSRRASMATSISSDPIVGTSLQVCKLPVSSRGRTSQLSTDTDFDFTSSFLKQLADGPVHLSREQSSLQAIDENRDQFVSEKQVSFSDLRLVGAHVPSKPMTAPAAGQMTGLERPDDLSLTRNATFTSIGSRGRGYYDPPPTTSSRSIAKIGRPIAQVSQIPDPDELFQAVQKQKEAAAAVDIQRIFRGYVARNVYKSLLSEERWKREEERKAAVRIQSIYRGHLSRKQAIYNRPRLDPEIVQWSKDVKEIQAEKAVRRQNKMDNLANEISSNHREANSKLSVIGPHVEIYDIYHPKKTGPTKRELNMASVMIQKVVRGWLIRRKMEKLARKATWYGSNFPKMVKEYKTMLKRVQNQHGVDKAKAPFSLKDMNDYIDLRRRYESVFEKKSFGGELEQGDIEAFFRECDLYPSQAEIEEAMDVTMHGQANKRGNQGLKKKELMDMIFYIYVPPATGLEGTRQSTWMNPIIDGQEARKLLGSEYVEPAPLAPCAKLVIDAKREQRQREQAQKEAEERRRIEESKQRREEEKQATKKTRKVTMQEPEEGEK